jgi:hypothetical protein
MIQIRGRPATCVHRFGMPGIPTNLWGESPLYENELPLERQYTKCKSTGKQVLDEGNCGRVTNREKEAREGVRKR